MRCPAAETRSSTALDPSPGVAGPSSTGDGPSPARERPGSTARRRHFEEEALPHLEALYAYALRLARGDEARADDLVQECLASAYGSWDTYRRGSNCKAWLMTILHHTAVNHLRYESRRRPALDLHEAEEHTVFEHVRHEDPEGRFFDRLVDREVLEAIDELAAEYRETLVLRDLEGLSYREIVEVLDVPLGTVKSRLFRARRTLQRSLYNYAHEMGYVAGGASE